MGYLTNTLTHGTVNVRKPSGTNPRYKPRIKYGQIRRRPFYTNAARELDRLCNTVQISDTGLIPGSGVGNHRMALNADTLGVPVLSVGVPTVADCETVARDVLGRTGEGGGEVPRGRGMFVTPDSIDAKIRDLAKLLGFGLDLALQPGLAPEDLEALLE